MSISTIVTAAALCGALPGGTPTGIDHRLSWSDGLDQHAQPSLALHEQAPSDGDISRPVLYIHGASIPSQLTVFYRFQGKSWADALNQAGFDVFGLDFAGFGNSERYPSMLTPSPNTGAPEGRSIVAVRQIESAVRFILARTKAERISIISHSWGTIAAGRFAAEHPDLVERLVLFGAVGQRDGTMEPIMTPWESVTVADQHAKFLREVPDGESPKLFAEEFPCWGEAYLASDPVGATRTPSAVIVPSGPGADSADAWSGRFPYLMSGITAPVLIVRGEWDSVGSAADARWLEEQLTRAARIQSVELPAGTHLMHLETGRDKLFDVTNEFLRKPINADQ